ncbi:Cas9 inhibitor AcrIIA9 family protein [Thomasclavelia cocleata]|uniref:Cas9 inhibitor AcrIIA9 family protein n=1 Tax=Thomasclavelia cocleata TaxID=69824 RepID=UPI00242BC339|nr:Cas9 inhibitor AcrIIA9 family protein [Thomasclavelia cocleata]
MDKIEEEIKKFKDGSLEKGIGLYLLERAKDDLTLANNLIKENKSLKGCAEYITGEVYKKAVNNQYFGWDNDELYQMALHYYQENEIKINKLPGNVKAVSSLDKQEQESKKTVESKPKTKKAKKPDVPEGQISLF